MLKFSHILMYQTYKKKVIGKDEAFTGNTRMYNVNEAVIISITNIDGKVAGTKVRNTDA